MDHTYGFRASLHKGGGPQVGEVRSGGLPQHANVIKLKWEIIWTRGLLHLSGFSSPTWGPPPPRKQAPNLPVLNKSHATGIFFTKFMD